MNKRSTQSAGLAAARPGQALSRRDFLIRSALAGLILPQEFGRRPFRRRIDPAQAPAYRHRIISVERLAAAKEEIDDLRSSDRISRAKHLREELARLDCRVPPEISGAKVVIIAAVFAKTMSANFLWKGRPRAVTVPPQYFKDDLNRETLKAVLFKDVAKNPAARLVDIGDRVPLKLLAARSGLGRFGRNNLIFVDGMGSANLLYAYATDVALPEDEWSDPVLLQECRHCHLCDRICPTRCMTRENFIIDAGRCITLYNEVEGSFPNYVLPSMHNALMGCLKCQSPCPANEGLEEMSGRFEDVSEEETGKILGGKPDDALLASLQAKLRQHQAVASKEAFPILTRNLGLLLRP